MPEAARPGRAIDRTTSNGARNGRAPPKRAASSLSVGTWLMKLAIRRTDGGNPVAVAPRIKAQWVSSGPGLGNVSYIAIIESGTENAIAARKNGKRAFLSRDSNRELA